MLLLFILHTIYLRAFIIMRQFFIIIAFLGTQLAEAQNKYMTIPQFSSDNAYYKEIACTFLVKDSKGNLARECRELYAFSTTNDTTIAGRSYMVYQEPVFTPEKNIWRNYYYREQSGRIYRYYDEENEEKLIYDFTLSKGDLFVRKDQSVWKVMETCTSGDYPDYHKEFGNDRKLLHLKRIENTAMDDIWIEGIGSVHTGLLDFEEFDSKDIMVERMFCNYNPEGNVPEYALFSRRDSCYKSSVAKGLEYNPDTDSERLFNMMIGEEHMRISFSDDTLHIEGYAPLYDANYIAYAVVNSNIVEVGIAPATVKYGVKGYGSFYRTDIKIPGFKPDTYIIRYKDPVFKDEQTVICRAGVTHGDVNSDGIVDISDIVAVINVIAGIAPNGKADVNNDNSVDISDIVSIINIISRKL